MFAFFVICCTAGVVLTAVFAVLCLAGSCDICFGFLMAGISAFVLALPCAVILFGLTAFIVVLFLAAAAMTALLKTSP